MTIDDAIASNDLAVMDRFFEANSDKEFAYVKIAALMKRMREITFVGCMC